jgi:hypothetical protein
MPLAPASSSSSPSARPFNAPKAAEPDRIAANGHFNFDAIRNFGFTRRPVRVESIPARPWRAIVNP